MLYGVIPSLYQVLGLQFFQRNPKLPPPRGIEPSCLVVGMKEPTWQATQFDSILHTHAYTHFLIMSSSPSIYSSIYYLSVIVILSLSFLLTLSFSHSFNHSRSQCLEGSSNSCLNYVHLHLMNQTLVIEPPRNCFRNLVLEKTNLVANDSFGCLVSSGY